MRTTDVHLLHVGDLDITAFCDLLELHHIDTVVDGGTGTMGLFAPESLTEVCAAQGFGYLPRGDQLDPAHAGQEAFEASAGSIAELSHAGRVVILNPHPGLPGQLESMGITLIELDQRGGASPYQRHLELE